MLAFYILNNYKNIIRINKVIVVKPKERRSVFKPLLNSGLTIGVKTSLIYLIFIKFLVSYRDLVIYNLDLPPI